MRFVEPAVELLLDEMIAFGGSYNVGKRKDLIRLTPVVEDVDVVDPQRQIPPFASLARRIVLEVTERASLDHIPGIHGKIAELRALGFQIAIDDLGAGYAGLTSFTQLEPEFVKLDMSLIRDVDQSSTKQKIIRSMVGLCHDMGKQIVAEGIERREERDALIELGCDLLQGYLFAKPSRPFPAVNG